MCINKFEVFSENEKIGLLQDYIDYLTIGDCQEYDLFCSLDQNNREKYKFLKAVVPVGYDVIDLKKVFKSNNTLKKIRKFTQKYPDYPLFYLMCAVCGALDCYNDNNLTLKKILGRGAKILLCY